MAKVLVNESSLSGIADAIREKNGTTEQYKPSEMAAAISAIETGGGASVNLLAHARNASNMFESATLPENVNITLGEASTGLAHNPLLVSTFYLASGVKNLKFDIAYNVSNLALNSTFRQCSAEILEIPFAEKACVTNWNRAFQALPNLKEIVTPLNFMVANNVNTIFYSSSALEEIRFVRESIGISISFAGLSKLSLETIQSIIDGLADMTGKTAQTLTLHNTVKGKLTETQISTITNKNWNLA